MEINDHIKQILSLFLYSGNLYRGIWDKQHKIKDTEIRKLATTLSFVVESGLASLTNKKYYSGWQKWVEWSNTKHEVNQCSADAFYVSIHLYHVLFVYGTKASIIGAFYDIRWSHLIVGNLKISIRGLPAIM